jgi:hypothetical protein
MSTTIETTDERWVHQQAFVVNSVIILKLEHQISEIISLVSICQASSSSWSSCVSDKQQQVL